MDELTDEMAKALHYLTYGKSWPWDEECEGHKSCYQCKANAALKAIDEAGFAVVPKELPKPFVMVSFNGEKPQLAHELRGPVNEVYATLIQAAQEQGEA